jgi:toxin CptA
MIIWLLTLPALWYSLNAATELRVDVGQWGDHTVLRGVHGREDQCARRLSLDPGERATIAIPEPPALVTGSCGCALTAGARRAFQPRFVRTDDRRPACGAQFRTDRATAHVRCSVARRRTGRADRQRLAAPARPYMPPEDSRRHRDRNRLDRAARSRAVQAGRATGQFAGQALLLGLTLALIASPGAARALSRWLAAFCWRQRLW